jgi:hypothetical protein
MKYFLFKYSFGIIFMITACNKQGTGLTYDNPDKRILFLHHSTGNNVWYGDADQNKRFSFKKSFCAVPRLIKEYNDKQGIKISIEERNFPKGNPYPWQNDPFDYYNIWVRNAGGKSYMEEPTLEMLSEKYDIIIFKHCFPVSNILEDDKIADINSKKRTLSNYKLQYNALRDKLYEFPRTKFIVWTGSALVSSQTNEEEAKRAMEFARWVRTEWDKPDDNIYVFDFREIETEGGLYLKPEFAVSVTDSHPNRLLSGKTAGLLVNMIINTLNN